MKQIDIFSISPPFLITFNDGSWKVAKDVFPLDQGVGFVQPFASEFDGDSESEVLSGSPWNTEKDVWELDYGTRVTALNQPNHHTHPGWSLWTQWLKSTAERALARWH